MQKEIAGISIEGFKKIIDVVDPCMDGYLYILGIQNNYFCISESAVERFKIPVSQFGDAMVHLNDLVYPEDREMLSADLERIFKNKKHDHNLQYRWLGKDDKPIWINCRGHVLFDDNGDPGFLVGCINEIGVKQKADNVSGLLHAENLLGEMSVSPGGGLHGFLIRLGIDNFKEINENKGMEYGDMIIARTAECIQEVMLPGQKLYRVVADEYIVVDKEGRSIEEAIRLYNKIQHKINRFIEEQHYEVFYTISAGILDFDRFEDYEYHNLMKLSEFALNEAKNRGKNKYYIYNNEAYGAFLHKKELISLMLQSINHGFEGFETYFQPIVDIRENNKFCHAETLLRFRTEELGMISPAEFIPLLEESNLIIPVGRWVLEQAMAACAQIQKSIPDFSLSVNLSYIQILKSNVLKHIRKGLEKYQLSPNSVVIELTESGFLEKNSFYANFCEGLNRHGIPLALDDFGTGYSNFSYLNNLDVSTIKIDRTFTAKALKNQYERNMLRHLSDMIHDMDLRLCVEGIETKEELERISKIKPDFIQGYYFGRPCPLNQFLEQFVPKNT